MFRVHQDETKREEFLLDLDEIVRLGARRMLAEALEAEVQDYIEAARGQQDEQRHALVVRNGHARERQILCGAGSVTLKAPRVNDKRVDEDGNRQRFKSDPPSLHAPLAEGNGGVAAPVPARSLQRGLRARP